MAKFLLSILALLVCDVCLAKEVFYKNIAVTIPDSWSSKGSILHDQTGVKVGELIPRDTWKFLSGKQFVSSFKKGFIDDPETTSFLNSGSDGSIFWVYRSSWYWDGKGAGGIWYARTFWVKGTILRLYSYKACEENFEEALKIANSVRES